MFPQDSEAEVRMSSRFQSKLISAEQCGADVLIARFSRPAGYEFNAGQWLRLHLRTGEGEQVRTFTHASAPADEWIEVATRISDSSFKRSLAMLDVGDSVEIAGPGGRLSLPEDARNVAFLVGGVGITPARSMLRDARQRRRTFNDAVVYYGNRSPECAPYLEELQGMTSTGVRVVPVFESGTVGTSTERGFVTADLVRRHTEDLASFVFIVAGPPAMTAAMESVLDGLGVSLEMRHVERFGTRAQGDAG
jgi:ferredoxin-NADP reductase